MARKKLSEFTAKTLFFDRLNMAYQGISFDTSCDKSSDLDRLSAKDLYVVKVDQGVKGRFKKGLVFLNVEHSQILNKIQDLEKKGFNRFLIEPQLEHKQTDERYFSIERTRNGLLARFSKTGGVDIEKHKENVEELIVVGQKEMEAISEKLAVPSLLAEKIFQTFDDLYFSFLEINPLIVLNEKIGILDAAVEVDSAAEFFVDGAWTANDFVEPKKEKEYQEIKNVETLAAKSQASFKLDLLNPDGSIFVLLSGGGASIVVADEVYNLGYGRKLANYGEYSGNPNEEETYIYTKNFLALLLKSKAERKVLIIGGGVANFTDVRVTFRGIIKALFEVKDKLVKENVKVFVRRGGPYQEEGLKLMKEFLQKEKLYGEVSGPEMVLTEIVRKGLKHIT